MHIFYLSTLFFALSIFANGQSFIPSAAPLITRSPYLNAWIDLTSGAKKPNSWPSFWSGNHTLGWAGFLRVDDGDTYEWQGDAMSNAALTFTAKSRQAAALNNIIITPTSTVFVLTAGPIQFNLTYLSPIEPNDIVLQSFPFSYVFFDAVSTDNQAHHVQVYTDLSGEWLNFANPAKISWDTTTSPSIIHSSQLVTPNQLQETTNMAGDGILYHATNPGPQVSWQTGSHYVLRGWFLSQGSLNNTKDPSFRNIDDNFPVFAYAHDLGSLSNSVSSIVWAIGLVRNPSIRQMVGGQSLDLPPFWTTRYNSVSDGIQAFLADSSNARDRATALDAKIRNEATKYSANYNDLVSLAARQTFAGVETALGPSNTVYMFMKDTGNSGRVNPVETLYAAYPAFLYLNATWGRYLLEPLMRYETSSLYNASYAARDIGPAFPRAEGSPNSNSLRSIDDSSSMLIMAWAQARFSGDQTLLNQYYSTFQRWADNIISSNALNPSGVQTADGLDLNNMSNLAIKGIIGIRAMAEISHTIGKGNDASKYQDQASTWASSWQTLAMSGGHLTSTYASSNSWSLMYNLYPDKLLGMNLISQNIYDAQDQFYTTQALSGNKFGLPYDSNAINVVKSHWTMLTAATTKDARDSLIKTVHDKATDSSIFAAFPSTYNSMDGTVISGWASPAQGAAFGLLSLNLESKLAGLSGNTGTGSSRSKTNVGAIVGGVIGGLAGLALIILGTLFFIRRRSNDQAREYDEGESKLKSFFSPLGGRHRPVPQDPLAEYHVEPMPLSSSSGFQSQVSYQEPNYVSQAQAPAAYTNSRSSFGNSNTSSGQGTQLSPLRLHNADQDVLPAHHAPPLPSKAGFVPVRATPSSEDIARYNASRHAVHVLPTAPSTIGGSSSDASQLRNEVENLRREMEEMRSRTMYEPPPQYT